jgi:hypothetical protein
MAMNIVHFDSQTSQVVIRASGFWSQVELMTFSNALDTAFDTLGRRGHPITILADLRGFVPQSQDVLAPHDFLAALSKVTIAQYAVVIESTLVRIQMRRFYEHAGIPAEYFADRATAIAWLGWEATDPILADC